MFIKVSISMYIYTNTHTSCNFNKSTRFTALWVNVNAIPSVVFRNTFAIFVSVNATINRTHNIRLSIRLIT